MTETLHYDAVIVGGGMVGAALACALGDTGLKVALVEHQEPAPFESSSDPDLRVSAFSIASQNILRRLGVWEAICQHRVCPYERMRVWEQAGRGDTEFHAGDVGEPCLGHIIENRVVQLALLKRAAGLGNLTLHCPASLKEIDYRPGGSTLVLEDGRRLATRLLIGADGGRSRVRQACGIGVHNWDYEQHALVATVVTAYPQQSITWQRFTPEGPQAFLPLAGPRASLVWYASPRTIARLQGLPDEVLLTEFHAAFPAELGTIRRIVNRGSFPLQRLHALNYVKQGVALVGDAAHMIHPLAGQGVNIGLLDAAALADLLGSATAQGRPIYSNALLQEYEKSRRTHNLLMMSAMDMFYRVFGNDQAPLKLVRNLGLGLADRLGPAKRQAIRFAMGLNQDLPPLARPLTDAAGQRRVGS